MKNQQYPQRNIDNLHHQKVSEGNNRYTKKDDVLDLRNATTSTNSNTHSQNKPTALNTSKKDMTVKPSRQPNGFINYHQINSSKDINPQSASIKSALRDVDYFSFVLLKSFVPKPNISLWQLSLLRAVFSPQTWLLMTLPIIFLQILQYRNFTINEFLESIKSLLSPDNFNSVVYAGGAILMVFMISLIFRSMVSASAIYVRLREIDNREVDLFSAIRASANTILRQSLNYIYHLILLIVITTTLLLTIKAIFFTDISVIVSNRFQLISAIFLGWLILLVMLYAKHWLQIGLFARSSTTRHIQLQSFKLLFSSSLQNISTSLFGLLVLSLGYGVIFLGNWLIVSFFTTQAKIPPTTILLVVSSVLIVLLISYLQYFQQNLWAHQYFYAASNSKKSNELLYITRSKPESIVPLIIIITICLIILGLYFLGAWHWSAQIKGFLANWHAEVPASLKLIIPIKQ